MNMNESKISNDINMDEVNAIHHVQKEFAKWHLKAVDKLRAKLQDNLDKRRICVEVAIHKATMCILSEDLVKIMENPPKFKVSKDIQSDALSNMFQIIHSWPGVDLLQCKEPPKNFKKYWRIADNWWNRQKGKWFGDLFFEPILQRDLNQYCQQILINKYNETHYHAIYFIFLCDLLHSEGNVKINFFLCFLFSFLFFPFL